MKTMNKTLLASLVVPFALGVQSASADRINTWSYAADSAFTDYSGTDGTNGITQNDDGTTDTLSWGGTLGTSSISITDDSGNDLVTDGGFVDGGVFSHNNRVISANDESLTTFDLTSTLTLTPLDPPGDTLPSDSRTFDSFFRETMNQTPCGFDSASTCDDVFTVGNVENIGGTANGDGTYDFESDPFTIEDYSYTVFLQLAGLTGLSDDACIAAGTDTGCVGLLTEEDDNNEFQARFRIASQQVEVPEPGTLALLGLGLAGLGLSRRKARK